MLQCHIVWRHQLRQTDENVAAVNMPMPTSGAFKHVCEQNSSCVGLVHWVYPSVYDFSGLDGWSQGCLSHACQGCFLLMLLRPHSEKHSEDWSCCYVLSTGTTCCWRELWDRSFLCAHCKLWGEEAWSSTVILDTSSVNHNAEWSDDFLKPLVDEIWGPSVGTSQLVPAFWHSDTEVVARHCFTSPLRVHQGRGLT